MQNIQNIFNMIPGAQSFKLIFVFLFFCFLSCQKSENRNCPNANKQLEQFYQNNADIGPFKESASESDTIFLPPLKILIQFISKNEFDKALKNNCSYRSFTGSRKSFSRFNEFHNENIYRINEDSLYFKSQNMYLIDNDDKTGALCGQYCDIKYFLIDKIDDYYLFNVFVQEGNMDILLSDSLTLNSMDYFNLPSQTIYNHCHKLLFSSKIFKSFPESNEITFYKIIPNGLKPVLRFRFYKKKISLPFFYKDFLFFIYTKGNNSFYAKMKIPSDEEFKEIKTVPRQMILDSVIPVPAPPSPEK